MVFHRLHPGPHARRGTARRAGRPALTGPDAGRGSWPALLVAAVALSACGDSTATVPSEPQPVQVETVSVQAEDVDLSIDSVGTLVADQMVRIATERPGRVQEIRFTEGGRVNAGDVLLVLEDEKQRAELAVAESSVTRAEVELQHARQRYERAAALRRQGVASQEEYDAAEADRDAAAAVLKQARAVRVLRREELRETVVRAPFGGLVGERRVDIGAYVKAGEAVTTLTDVDPIMIGFSVPEKHLAALRMEQPVEAVVTSFATRVFPGTVVFIDPRVDPVNRTVKVKAAIPNPELRLRPGQFATVRLLLDRHVGVPVIPEEAVVAAGDSLLVYAVEDSTASARRVEIGIRLPGKVEVRSGLKPGEVIVRLGHEKLRPDGANAIVEARSVADGA